VKQIKAGDRVVIPFNISCGDCWMCNQGLYAQCETTQVHEHDKGASLFGYTKLYGEVPGGQAEYLRVPQAHFGPIKVPDNSAPDERFLFLSDVLPTASSSRTTTRWRSKAWPPIASPSIVPRPPTKCFRRRSTARSRSSWSPERDRTCSDVSPEAIGVAG
jgi:Alcohol dehydrogenase GroES-like domain